MKKNSNRLVILLLLFTLACGHNIERNDEQNFIPPTLKNQPRLVYPKDAQEKSYSGSTKLILSITDLGTVGKVFLEKSSGIEMLDKTAIDYCKNLVFVPAKQDDKSVYSRLRWEIQFNISTQDLNKDKYIDEIKNLFSTILNAPTSEKNKLERTVLMKHDDFVNTMTDALNFNAVCEQVILPEVSEEWKNDWNGWPLSFILYHDFLVRFSDYDSLSIVKAKLVNSLKFDIQYIKNTPAINHDVKKDKENILMKIKNFISKHYPDILLDNLGFDEKNDSRSITFHQSYANR